MSDNYCIIKSECIKATKKVLKKNVESYGIDRVLTCPMSFAVFTLRRDIETDVVKNIVTYFKRHANKLGVEPMHKKAEIAQYCFTDKNLISRILHQIRTEE